MGRKAIPKFIRFEVFKRDKFTCQYCGASAPEVILEIDHIKPVSKGGTDDMMNLVTSCRDCNRGKTNRELTDDSTVMVQKQRLDEMQERREQLKMMMEWREELEIEIEAEIDSVDSLLQKRTQWGMSDVGRNNLRKLLNRFGYNDVYEATEIAIDQYYNGSERSWQNAFSKIGGICYNRKKAREENAKQDH